ncbi:MAG: Uma2 family endonuclease [Chloroflexota bacterium]|nr:Uma2 family endonuclease [Chloroflexota bacterium]
MAIDVHSPELRIVSADDATILDLDPIQGLWTGEQYLRITDSSRWLLEFTDGKLEVLPMPTEQHQAMLGFLYVALLSFLQPRGGKVFFAPLRLQLREGKFREPDLLIMRDAQDPRRQNAYWLGADLVIEIVSPDNPERDTIVKRGDYADAHIPEYWIVNPEDQTITVLRLDGDLYAEYGVFGRGETVRSLLLESFSVTVNDVLDAQKD